MSKTHLPRWLPAYDTGWMLALAAVLPYYGIIRGRRPVDLLQRFGYYPSVVQASLAKPDRPVWIHAASVGETLTALPLLAALRARCPQRRWVVSTATPTGQQLARERLPADHTVLYAPWDVALSVRRAIAAIRPRLFLSMEMELWPNRWLRLAAAGVPIAVVNGRISTRSFARYQRAKRLLAPALACVRVWAMQTPADGERMRALGVPEDRVHVLGNIKADIAPPVMTAGQVAALRASFGLGDAPLLVAGSTHPKRHNNEDEERIVLGAWRQVRVDHPSLRLLIAPRHPERMSEVERLIRQAGFTVCRRSTIGAGAAPGPQDIILLDTLGELAAMYALADIAFVGGSFAAIGGHNVLEPAQWAKPVLTGPHTGNFQSLVELLSAAGGLRVIVSAETLAAQVRQWLAHPERRRQAGEQARAAVAAQAGATTRTVQVLCEQFGDALLTDDV